jgi:hypothetical protein
LASGFASSEFQSDFGEAYSGLIPLHGEPVLRTVMREIPVGAPVTVTIPTGCYMARHVAGADHTAQLVEVQPTLPLADAAKVGLEAAISHSCGEVVLLFADTVVHGGLPADSISASAVCEGHPYTLVRESAGGRLEFSPKCSSGAPGLACIGAFVIADPRLLLACLSVPYSVDVGSADAASGSAEDSRFFAALTGYSASRPMRVEIVDGWGDAGHRASWTGLRRRRFETRDFNKLELRDDGYLHKVSTQSEKISQEFAWFGALPSAVSNHCPRVKPCQSGVGYLVEFLPSPTLGERVLWGRHGMDDIGHLIDSSASLLLLMQSNKDGLSLSDQRTQRLKFYVDGTAKRLELLREQEVGNLVRDAFEVNGARVQSLSKIAEEMADVLLRSRVFDLHSWSIMHGDFFLGNLIFDSSEGLLKMIDPRGSFVDHGIWGDPLYDIGKLSHSLLGAYDVVAAGLFSLTQYSNTRFDVALTKPFNLDDCARAGRAVLHDLAERLGLCASAVRAVEALVFLRMLPLHADSPGRQRALIACALEARAEALRGRGE